MVLSFSLAAQHFCQNRTVRAQVAQIHISKQWMFRNPWRIQKHREGIRPGLDFSEVRLENWNDEKLGLNQQKNYFLVPVIYWCFLFWSRALSGPPNASGRFQTKQHLSTLAIRVTPAVPWLTIPVAIEECLPGQYQRMSPLGCHDPILNELLRTKKVVVWRRQKNTCILSSKFLTLLR